MLAPPCLIQSLTTPRHADVSIGPNGPRRYLFILGLLFLVWGTPTGRAQPNTGMADPSFLISLFDRFVTGGGGSGVVVLSLSNLRGLSSEAQNAGGRVRVDLTSGTVTSRVTGLPLDGSLFDLWLVDNRPNPGHTTFPETGDVLLKVGTYGLASGVHTLSVALGSAAFTTLFPDRAFVVRSGHNPKDS